MNWHNADEFFAMGGYGLYVWGSYSVTLLWMLAEPWLARRRHAKALQAVAREMAQDTDSDMNEGDR